ncbi:MAG TPA: hypothetical protein VM121_04340 [Acidimicrobiales bacterium]|nr:hypothetical protein [Acidimicrobiales bacterium]
MGGSVAALTLQTALAAAAGLVALGFSMSTFERWLRGRRRHELAWSVSLAMFTLGSAALWLGAANGWSASVFRAFYLFGAILNVPFLALGTIYLLGSRRLGDLVGAGVALASAFATGILVASPLHGSVPAHELPRGSEVFGPLPRILAAVASGLAALVVIGGALWSAWRLRAGPRAGFVGSTSRMFAANVLIALGTIVLGIGGLFNSALGEMEAFAVTLVIGITLIFAGFLVATQGAARGAPATSGERKGDELPLTHLVQ